MKTFTLEDLFNLNRTGEVPKQHFKDVIKLDVSASSLQIAPTDRYYAFFIINKSSGMTGALIFDENLSFDIADGKWKSAPLIFKSVKLTSAAQAGKSFELLLVRDPCHLSQVSFAYGS